MLEGNLHGDDLRYKFQPDFAQGNPSPGLPSSTRLSGDLWFRAASGSARSRWQNTSSGKLELTDRSITDKIFGAGRDIGVASNGYEESPEIEWTVGVWNGTGDAAQFEVKAGPADEPIISVTNVPAEVQAGVHRPRRAPTPAALAGLQRGRPRRRPAAPAAASFGAETNFDKDTTSNDKFGLDYIVKAQGFSSTGGYAR
ncbi:MAG: hypothetical protein IPL61_38495 [Myxococcales bacterium]|nr:hypothetical protein [Myxococcales bacterium]